MNHGPDIAWQGCDTDEEGVEKDFIANCAINNVINVCRFVISDFAYGYCCVGIVFVINVQFIEKLRKPQPQTIIPKQ